LKLVQTFTLYVPKLRSELLLPTQGHEICLTTDENKSIELIGDYLHNGYKVHIPCFSKRLLEHIHNTLKIRFGDKKKFAIFTADNPLKSGLIIRKRACLTFKLCLTRQTLFEPGDDINEICKEVDVLGHTATIDCGISILELFHYCVAFVNDYTRITHECAIQMMERPRFDIFWNLS